MHAMIARRLRPLFLLATLAAAITVSAPARAEAPARPKVVVELFTSQGCSSCPPADAYLRELARGRDVLALSMHVDYWNGLGWPDPFSSPEVTARQRAYAPALGASYVYTPQMVVAGRTHAVGSDRAKVARLIADARGQLASGPMVSLTSAGPGRIRAVIGAAPVTGTATVWLVAFDDGHTTRVGRGENGGRTLAHANVVRTLRAAGTWSGAATELVLDVTGDLERGYGNWAVLVQAQGPGSVLGAAVLPAKGLNR